MPRTKNDYLRELMNVYWLRPETAMWRTLDCMVLDGIEFKGQTLDFGCGDGLFSLTRAGGKLDPAYDMFLQAGGLDTFFDKTDIYDHYDPRVSGPRVITPGDYTIDVGVDHKAALLQKAFQTGLYKETVVADGNQPLPLEDERFDTIFSNIVYWLGNYRGALKELHRVCAPGGRVMLHLISETFPEYSFYQRYYVKTQDPRFKFLELVDRGRTTNDYQACLTREEWEAEFKAAGFKVANYRRYMSRTVLEAWDIGLRPISPYLIRMANGLPPEERQAIKQDWIEGLMPLISPLCELDWPTDATDPAGFHFFVLEK